MNWHILLAVGLWIFVAVSMGWNRLFRGYCLQSLAYFKKEVLPQLQDNGDFKKEATSLESEVMPQTDNYITDSSLIIIPLTCVLLANSALFIFVISDIPVSGFLNGLMAFGNATIAVWISISRTRYFKIRAHVVAQHTLLQAEEFHEESLDELEEEKKGED